MRFTADRKALAAAVKSVVINGGHQPIHSALRMDAADGQVRMAATNGDLAVTATIDADVTEEGTAIPPATLLAGFLSGVKGERVEVVEAALAFTASCGDSAVALRCHHPSIWPTIEQVTDGAVELSASDIDSLNHVLHAQVSGVKTGINSLTHPEMAGVHMNGSRFEAFNGYTLAVGQTSTDLPKVTVPTETINRVARQCTQGCTVAASERLVTFATATSSWTSRIIAKDFPAVQAALDLTGQYRMTFDTAELAEALGRMGLLDESIHHVTVLRDGGKAILTNVAQDVGEVTDLISVEGDYDSRMILDHRLLAGVISAHDEPSVTFEIDGPTKPVLIRSSDRRFIHVIVPVHPTARRT